MDVRKVTRTSTVLVLLSLFVARGASVATMNVPADASTIQAGIDLAQTGDTVLFAAGTRVISP
jgi:hypothetical protein